MRSIDTTIDIDASPAAVWAVLGDTASYPEWNPFIPALDGAWTPGARLDVRISPPGSKGMALRPTVVAVAPNEELRWVGHLGVRGIFDGEHRFALTPLPGGRTRFSHSEQFSGVLAPFVGRVLRKTAAGFEAMNEALRDRVELLSRSAR